MNLNRIRTIIDKEWEEVFKNKMVIITVAIMPVVFTLLPLGMIYGISAGTPAGDIGTADVPLEMLRACGDITGLECMQRYLINQFLLLFMMMPLIIPSAIAAYSIVGEKTTRSLEPLLATPITTTELLTGKALAAAVPAIAITIACFAIFVLLLPVAGATPGLVRYVLEPLWLVAILVVGPLMAIASVNMAVIVSSRVNDPRVAEQVTAVLVVPVLGLMFGQIAGLFILDMRLMMITVLAIAAVDVILIRTGARLFRRETILTRWK